jgi:hypothetical protein
LINYRSNKKEKGKRSKITSLVEEEIKLTLNYFFFLAAFFAFLAAFLAGFFAIAFYILV